MTPTFKEYIGKAMRTDNPAGDLIEDMRSDKQLPENFEKLDSLRTYLQVRGACRGAVDAAADVWHRFVQWRKDK
jgi:hypothetical protein